MLVDEAEMAGSVAEHLGLPFVSIACFPPWMWNDTMPPFLFGWGFGAGPVARLRAADAIDPRVAGIVAKTIGIDTHNHVDVPLTAAEMPGPDIDLKGEMKRSGLSAICMTFATDYQPGDAYGRFLKGLASMDRQLERNGMKRSPRGKRQRAMYEGRN
jgi:hypothetical protein